MQICFDNQEVASTPVMPLRFHFLQKNTHSNLTHSLNPHNL